MKRRFVTKVCKFILLTLLLGGLLSLAACQGAETGNEGTNIIKEDTTVGSSETDTGKKEAGNEESNSAAESIQTNGSRYYVDFVSGSDSNDGTSPEMAWKTLDKVNNTTFQAGDRILFKAGCTWTGTLWPKGSGESGNPIVIDMYGTGNKPVIDGNGKSYSASDEIPIDSAVYLRDQSYWTIRNLEIINDSARVGDRQGIHIDGSGGSQRGIVIEENVIHHVSGDGNHGENVRMAAINVWSRSWNTSFADVLVRNNEIYTTGSAGIYINAANWAGPATGVVVSNNYLHDIGGSGITMIGTNHGLIEYNTVNGAHVRSNQYCVAIWPYDADDTVIQYNEVYNTKTTKDGQGLDSDYQCRRSIFQYNYVHDNDGGFILICCEPTTWDGKASYNDGTIVRYNIAQNNKHVQIMLSTKPSNTYIYNNTIFVDSDISTKIVDTWSRDNKAWPENTFFWNNIFYHLGSDGSYNFGKAKNIVFNYNVFYGTHHASEPSDPHKMTLDPMLRDPGKGGEGRDSVDGYMLKPDSPCIGSGMLIPDNGGKDYWGNPVSSTEAPNRGAYNGEGRYD